MNPLSEAAQQALEALEDLADCGTEAWSEQRPCVQIGREAITALRSALAQQAEPDHETRAELAEQQVVQLAEERDHYRNLWQKAQEQAEPLNLSDPAVRKRLASQWGYVPAAAQAEPVEPVQPGAWVASKDGRVIYDYDFTHDVVLRVMGDFENDEQRISYAKQIVDKLNAAPPRRTMVPLTEKEMYAVEEEARKNFRLSQKGPRGQQITYWDVLTPWLIRAVEKASWEKNNGQA